MATATLPTKKMSLPVELFYGAMERQLSLADYARNVDLHPDILRQALTGGIHGTDSHPLNALAKAVNRDPEQVDLAALPANESFSMWLKRNMEGISQHALRTRAKLDRQTLKCFLNGDQLPDSDQAERISRALYIDRREIARVITANMAAASPAIAILQSLAPPTISPASNVSAKLGAPATVGQLVASMRQKRTSARHTSSAPASLPSAATPATIGETASTAIDSATPATQVAAKASKRLQRTPKPEAQLPDQVVAAVAAHQPHNEAASSSPSQAQGADRDDRSAPAEIAQLGDQGLPPAPSPRLAKSRSRRQPNQAIASIPNAMVDADTSIQSSQPPTLESAPASESPAPVALDRVEAPAPPVQAESAAERVDPARRPKRTTTRALANAAAAEQTPALAATNLAMDKRPAGVSAAEDRSAIQPSSRKRPRNVEATAADISSNSDASASFAAEQASPKPEQPSASTGAEQTTRLVAAELAADTTTLQLSLDEVRLIRHWRHLHPHGRRATLQYIGSLLVDD